LTFQLPSFKKALHGCAVKLHENVLNEKKEFGIKAQRMIEVPQKERPRFRLRGRIQCRKKKVEADWYKRVGSGPCCYPLKESYSSLSKLGLA